MPLLSGSFSFKRFAVSGELPLMPDDSLIDPLSKFAFGQAARAAGDGTELGFVTCEHLFDTEFDLPKCCVGEFVYFQLRQDKNKVPGDLLRAYTRQEEAALLKASGRAFLLRHERKEAKANAQDRADREARSGAFRKISTFPALLDLGETRLLFGSSSQSASESFKASFEMAFDLGLDTVSCGELATRIAQQSSLLRSLEDVRPFNLIDPPGEHQFSGLGGNLAGHDKDFLGIEFLTWLCSRGDLGDGVFELPGRGVREAAVLVDRVAEMTCVYAVTGTMSLKCDGPGRAPELRTALLSGKQVRKAGLILSFGGEQFTLTLDGPAFTVSGLTLPQSADGQERQQASEDPLAERQARFEAIREVLNVLDRLFGLFLRRRLASEWPKELNEMRQWVLAGSNAKVSV